MKSRKKHQEAALEPKVNGSISQMIYDLTAFHRLNLLRRMARSQSPLRKAAPARISLNQELALLSPAHSELFRIDMN